MEKSWGAGISTRVYVTGRVEIESGGRLVAEQQFPGRQGRLLFAYLVCNRQRPVTREELAYVLRPTRSQVPGRQRCTPLSASCAASSRVSLSPKQSASHAFGTYLLQVGTEVWIDREAVTEALDQAEGLLRANDPKGAWAPCNIAAITARRPFLAGEDAEWIARERARLHGVLIRALDCLAEIWIANGEPALALEAARETVALEPFRETGYQRLIRVQTLLGNRAEALRVYENCRELLASELGTDPSQDTQALYFELLGTP